MGLDISVRCSVESLIQSVRFYVENPKEECPFKYINFLDEFLKDHPMNISPYIIKTRPGSYGGLHRLRAEFTRHMGLPIKAHFAPFPDEHKKFHLLNHSDCDGWYLPSMFEEPIWTNKTSIGSSYKLLEELEMIPVGSSEWIALYIPTVASILECQPIKFH